MRRFLLLAAVALIVPALPARASYYYHLAHYRPLPEAPEGTSHILTQMKLAMKDGMDAYLSAADATLRDAAVTTPAVRQAIQTCAAMARVTRMEGADVAAELVKLYDADGTSKLALIHYLPDFLDATPPGQRLAVIDAVQKRAEADGLFAKHNYALTYDMARVVTLAMAGDVEKTIAALEAVVHNAAPGYFDSFRTSARNSRISWPYVPRRHELSAKATPEQLERLAAVQQAWAGIVEAKAGFKTEAFVTSTQLRTAANETRRLGQVKRAALEAAAKMAE